jgi:hypothetical protein
MKALYYVSVLRNSEKKQKTTNEQAKSRLLQTQNILKLVSSGVREIANIF